MEKMDRFDFFAPDISASGGPHALNAFKLYLTRSVHQIYTNFLWLSILFFSELLCKM